MALTLVELGAEYIPDPTVSRAVSFAQIFVGIVDTDPLIVSNRQQLTVRQEDGTEVPVAQPILTGAGGVPLYQGSPVQLLTDDNYSLKILDKNGAQIYYIPRNPSATANFISLALGNGTIANPSLSMGVNYGLSHDPATNRFSTSANGIEGFRVEENGSGKIKIGSPEEWDTDYPSFQIDGSFSRGPFARFRSMWVADPGDTPEVGFLAVDGTASSPVGVGEDWPSAFIYWLPYDGTNQLVQELYGPVFGEAQYTGDGATVTFDASSLTQTLGDYGVYIVPVSFQAEKDVVLQKSWLQIKDTDYTVSSTDVIFNTGPVLNETVRIFERSNLAMTAPFYGRTSQISSVVAETATDGERGGALVFHTEKEGEIAVRPTAWVSNIGHLVVAGHHACLGDGKYPDDRNVGTLQSGFTGSAWTKGVNDIDGHGTLTALSRDTSKGATFALAKGDDWDNDRFQISHVWADNVWQFQGVTGGTVTTRMTFNAANGDINLGIRNNTPSLALTTIPLQVNSIQVAGSSTTNDPTLEVVGTDTDISLKLLAKGTGAVNLHGAGGRGLSVAADANAVNYIQTVGTATGVDPLIKAAGANTTINIIMEPKGAGNVNVMNGNVVVSNGKGIDFSDTPDASGATSSVFTDYEEGTWTPFISDGVNVATTSTSVGLYTKTGRKVHIQAHVVLTSLGSVSGNLFLGGLPYTSANISSAFSTASVGFASNLSITAGVSITGLMDPNTDAISLRMWDSTAGTSTMQDTNLTASGELVMEATYYV